MIISFIVVVVSLRTNISRKPCMVVVVERNKALILLVFHINAKLEEFTNDLLECYINICLCKWTVPKVDPELIKLLIRCILQYCIIRHVYELTQSVHTILKVYCISNVNTEIFITLKLSMSFTLQFQYLKWKHWKHTARSNIYTLLFGCNFIKQVLWLAGCWRQYKDITNQL